MLSNDWCWDYMVWYLANRKYETFSNMQLNADIEKELNHNDCYIKNIQYVAKEKK